jgi:hypothetical protein
MISRFVTLATPCGAATAASPLRLRISQYRMKAGNARFIFAFGAALAPVAVDRATGECETSITLTQDRSCRRAAASPTAPGVRDHHVGTEPATVACEQRVAAIIRTMSA